MSTNIMSNKLNTAVTIHCTSNSALVIPGNSSVSSIATGSEVLTGAYIAQIHWSCPPDSFVKITREGFVVGVFDSSSYIDFAGCGMPITKAMNKNLAVDFIGTSSGYCIIEMQKVFIPLNISDPDTDNPDLLLDFANNYYETVG